MVIDLKPVHNAAILRPAPVNATPAPAVRAATAIADAADIAVETGAPRRGDRPVVDIERVDQIRRALEDGSYPVVPTRIADAMIAARLMLSIHE